MSTQNMITTEIELEEEDYRNLDKVLCKLNWFEIEQLLPDIKRDDTINISREIRKGNGYNEFRDFIKRKNGHIILDVYNSKYADVTIKFRKLDEDIYGRILDVFTKELFNTDYKVITDPKTGYLLYKFRINDTLQTVLFTGKFTRRDMTLNLINE